MASPSFTALLFKRGGGLFLPPFCAISPTDFRQDVKDFLGFVASTSFTALLFRRGGSLFLQLLPYFLNSFLRISDRTLGTFWPRSCGIALLFRRGGGSFLLPFCTISLTLFYGFQAGR